MSNGIETPRPLTPQEFARLQGQQSFIDYINETNNQLGMLQELQRVAGDGDLLDEDTGETPIGSLDPSLAEESVWDMLTSIMAGRQGTIQGLNPEIIEALETSVEGLNDDELRVVAAEIVAAGGYDAWLTQQPTGDPGGLEPDTDLEEEVIDIDEDTTLEDEIGVDPDMPITDPTLPPLEGEGEGLLDRLGSWWEGVLNNIGSGSSGSGSSGPPMLPGSSGVILNPGASGMSWPDIISNPGAWQVYLPGVIPGLPQSPTIIGTIEDILSNPGQVLGDLWDEIESTVANPGEFLEDLLNGVVDDDGLITIGGISTVVGTIYDDLFGNDETQDTSAGGVDEEDTVVGGANEEDEALQLVNEDLDQNIIVGDPNEQRDEILGGSVEGFGGGGGGGGMMRRGQPHMGGIPFGLPQGEMILYSPPPTANKLLTDFTNDLAMQRKRGMLV